MKLKFDGKTPILILEKYTITGWASIPEKYPNQNAIIFANDENGDFIQHNLFELIKKYRISDFPDERIEILVENTRVKSKPRILESVPYPFWGIKIGVSDKNFVITFEMIQDINYHEEEWDKKWTNEFYFDNISKMLHKEDDLEVLYEKDGFLVLDLSVKLFAENNSLLI